MDSEVDHSNEAIASTIGHPNVISVSQISKEGFGTNQPLYIQCIYWWSCHFVHMHWLAQNYRHPRWKEKLDLVTYSDIHGNIEWCIWLPFNNRLPNNALKMEEPFWQVEAEEGDGKRRSLTASHYVHLWFMYVLIIRVFFFPVPIVYVQWYLMAVEVNSVHTTTCARVN